MPQPFMKILELRFKNLNSLYGEWIIDFTHPEYASNGIFALTGPTGAGKSTILDAICLALYGATPRLGPITATSNDIMSRQTGECYAEVLFESQAGRFRCQWQHHCARNKAGGKLQPQRHEIADANTGLIIENKKSLVVGVIEAKTGMDFDRFTRSMLLAQGGFDTFLKANSEDKSKVLEQITGTGIYSAISQRVHERHTNERDTLKLLQAATDSIVLLDSAQAEAMQQKLSLSQHQEKKRADELTATHKAIHWLTTIDNFHQDINSLNVQAANHQIELEAFKPARRKLEQALQAASLDGDYATLISLREQLSQDEAALAAQARHLPQLESHTSSQAQALEAAELLKIQAQDNLKIARPIIQHVRSLDQQLAEFNKAILAGAESCHIETANIKREQQACVQVKAELAQSETALETIAQYFIDHAQDEWLISGLSGIEAQITSLLAKQKEIANKQAQLEAADTSLQNAVYTLKDSAKQTTTHKQTLATRVQQLQQTRTAMSELLGTRSLGEYRSEKDTLLREVIFQHKILALEDYRNTLENNQPCPLCGSLEHPFNADTIPKLDETEQKIDSLTSLITKAEDLEIVIKAGEQAEAKVRQDLNHSATIETTAVNTKNAIAQSMSELNNNLNELQLGFDTMKLNLAEKLRPLGIEIIETQVSSLLDNLTARLNHWQQQVKQKTDIEQQLTACNSRIAELNAVIDHHNRALTEKQNNLAQLQNQQVSAKALRHKLYGDKLPDHEEAYLLTAIENVELAETQARNTLYAAQHKMTTTQTHVQSLQQRVKHNEPILTTKHADFILALKPLGFADEAEFIAAQLNIKERKSLADTAQLLDNTHTEITAKYNDRKAGLAIEQAKQVTDKTLAELQPKAQLDEASLLTLRDTIAGLKHQLNDNAQAQLKIQDQQLQIDAQTQECHRWAQLHELIGSADGKKYRNFAQGLTFELMVNHANKQLEKMTDRYLLIRHDHQPLELNVIDQYQAGEIRSTKNLSGGESFIISLTLALGLSKMASHKVRVDSLFLDEGFGTLDEDALETALETLSSLHQEGKLIGIISHVLALKERISTQINVAPGTNGRSLVNGPGCQAIAANQSLMRA